MTPKQRIAKAKSIIKELEGAILHQNQPEIESLANCLDYAVSEIRRMAHLKLLKIDASEMFSIGDRVFFYKGTSTNGLTYATVEKVYDPDVFVRDQDGDRWGLHFSHLAHY